jgi:iron complex outermembrane receptor protein
MTISSNKNKDFFFYRDGVLTALESLNIAYSPDFIAGNIITFAGNLQVSRFYQNCENNIWEYRKVQSLNRIFVNDLNFRMSSNLNGF